MSDLQLLAAAHEKLVLDFEVENRAYFAASISDRGDDYFEHFSLQHNDLLAEQEAGEGAYYVLVDGGLVIGRFNLHFDGSGIAVLGYRVAARAAGSGVATAAVHDVCRLASKEYDIRTVRAATSHANVASQRVLLKNGFVPVGPADAADVGGNAGTSYERNLTTSNDC